MIEELKPCPFCGNKNLIIQKDYSTKKQNVVAIHCKPCGAIKAKFEKGITVRFNTKKEAIEAWNKRYS